jgi:hypothetical protein
LKIRTRLVTTQTSAEGDTQIVVRVLPLTIAAGSPVAEPNSKRLKGRSGMAQWMQRIEARHSSTSAKQECNGAGTGNLM